MQCWRPSLFTGRSFVPTVEALHSQETATRLAQKLTLPPSDNSEIADLCLELGQPELLDPDMNFTSIIVKLNSGVESSGIFLEDILNDISYFLEHYHLKCLFVEKEYSIWSTIYMEAMRLPRLHFPP